MLGMAKNALVLFLRGRLFAEPGKAILLMAAGALFTALLCLGLAGAGLPLWGAVIVASFLGGGLQPILLKRIRFR
jgi:hypothetical protein